MNLAMGKVDIMLWCISNTRNTNEQGFISNLVSFMMMMTM